MACMIPFLCTTLLIAGPIKPGKFEQKLVAKAARPSWVSYKQQASGLSHKEFAAITTIRKSVQTGKNVVQIHGDDVDRETIIEAAVAIQDDQSHAKKLVVATHVDMMQQLEVVCHQEHYNINTLSNALSDLHCNDINN